MILHTVAFKTKHKPNSPEERDFLKAGVDLGQLPMVQNFCCYKQVSSKNAFDFGFSMEFESRQAYDAYNQHPAHVDFVQSRWIQEVVDFLELDYMKHQVS
jgi:hypothetical protein